MLRVWCQFSPLIIRQKDTLNRVIAKAESERRRKIERKEFYESLALEVRLDRLDQVTAYKRFLDELNKAFRDIGTIPYISSSV